MNDSQRGIALLTRNTRDLPMTELMLASLLGLASDGIRQRFAEALQPHAINRSEFLALAQLFIDHADGISPADLCRLTDQTRANMTRIADALAERNFITRSTHEQDRRRVILRISPAGRDFVRKLLPHAFRPIQLAFAALSPPEQQNLQTQLQAIIGAIDSTPGQS